MDGSLMKKKRNSKDIYDKYITMENIYKMWSIIRVTCKNKKEVYYFSLNLNSNLNNVYNALKNKTYKPFKYKIFMIFEPKPRLVMSQKVFDKIVNHFVANYYLIPYIEPCLIDSNVATRTNRGSSYAMNLLKKYFNKLLINYPNKEVYCLKIDISKYFYSIDHEILLELLKEKINDGDVINLINLIISETNSDYVNENVKKYNEIYNTDIPFYKENKGLSIGAMSSQFLAIFYLNKIDHYIKEKLKCKYFMRYMDDLLILDHDKEKLKNYYKLISNKIEKLKLNVNKKSNLYRSSKGFSFLGYTYKVINNKLHITCKKETYIRINKKLKYLQENNHAKYRKSMGSYYGYFKEGKKIEREEFKLNSKEVYNLYKKEKNNYLVIVKDKRYYKVYGDDAILIWYLFNYKYNDGVVMFGNNCYDKVVNELREKEISFVIASKVEELLSFEGKENIYLSNLYSARKKYERNKKEQYLINRLKNILEKNPDNWEKIYHLFNELEKNKYSKKNYNMVK